MELIVFARNAAYHLKAPELPWWNILCRVFRRQFEQQPGCANRRGNPCEKPPKEKHMRVFLIPAFLSTLLVTPALAQEQPQQQTRNCGTIDEVRTMLTEKYHEAPVGFGVAANGDVLLTVYASPDGKTWSVVMSRARDGLACITAEGTDWQAQVPDQGTGL
jgi:hypothetical protein